VKYSLHKEQILFSLLVVLHLVGFIGLQSSYKALFVSLTPYNLVLSFALVIYNHKSISKAFLFFMFLCFIEAWLIEVVGVRTGLIFGQYQYGDALGIKVLDTPLLIGLNWLMLIYGSGIISEKFSTNPFVKAIIAATMLLLFDIIMEPVAVQLNFWTWENDTIPFQNYVAWFLNAFLLQLLFQFFNFNKSNRLGVLLFAVQFVFFAALRILQIFQ
jgi:putative membrane protein